MPTTFPTILLATHPGCPPRAAGVALSWGSALVELGDGLGNGEDAAGVVDVEVLDHAAVDGRDALAGGGGFVEGGDDLASGGDLVVARRVGPVARVELARVDEGLPVEA